MKLKDVRLQLNTAGLVVDKLEKRGDVYTWILKLDPRKYTLDMQHYKNMILRVFPKAQIFEARTWKKRNLDTNPCVTVKFMI